MTFVEIKENIQTMKDSPDIILQKMLISCHIWWSVLLKMEDFVEKHINDENYKILECPFSKEEEEALEVGYMILPAIMLTEEKEISWQIYSSLIILFELYGHLINSARILEIVNNLNILIQAKNSWKAILIQSESLIIQAQSMINANNVPYNLSRRFLTSILNTQD